MSDHETTLRGLADYLRFDLMQRFDDWAVSTEFTRHCKNPVDVGDQMALRDAHALLSDFADVVRKVAEPELTSQHAACLAGADDLSRPAPPDDLVTRQATTDAKCSCNYPYLKERGLLDEYWSHKTHAPHCVFYEGAKAAPDAMPEDVCHCGHTRKAHCWTDGKHRCYHGRCQCWSFGRRQEAQP